MIGEHRLKPSARPSAAHLVQIALVVVLMVPNIVLTQWSLDAVVRGVMAVDFAQYVEAGERVWDGALYGSTSAYGWRYSPVLAYAFSVFGLMGPFAWRLLHVAAALALPGWKLIVVTLVSWPFWFDVETGNTMVFVLLAGAWALRGNTAGIFGFLALALLIPRPLMLPLVAWILWKYPQWRWRFAAMFLVHGLAVMMSGWGPEWIAELLWSPGIHASPSNVGPSRFVGLSWMILGLPLAAFLTWKGRIGLASLSISPYLLPYYLIMGLLELVPIRISARRRTDAGPA